MVVTSWSELPGDIIHCIDECLPYVEDSIRFAAVCKSSHTSSVERRSKPFGPWLMLAKLVNDNITSNQQEAQLRSCYSFSSSTNKLFNLALPELQGRRCWGTTHGWLFTIGLDLNIFLFHPFTRARLILPSQPNFTCRLPKCVFSSNHHICQSFVTKVALSSNPSCSNSLRRCVVVMVLYYSGYELGFASIGDKSWTHIKINRGMNDVIFFMGNFYCLDNSGVLWICNIDTPHPTAKPISTRSELCTNCLDSSYLVEISGRLYGITHNRDLHRDDPSVKTDQFEAFVFDFHNKRWTGNVQDFNGHALLLGNNTSCAISAFDNPELKSNCIYFTDDNYDLYSSESGYDNDMGVYDFTTKTLLEPFYKCTDLASEFARPFFFIPTLS